MCPHPKPPPPPPSPSRPSGSSQCTSFECPVLCIKLGLVIYFTYGNIHVSMLLSQIIPPSPSATESKSLFFISVSLCCLTYRVIVIGSEGKVSASNAGNLGSIPGSGRFPWRMKWQPTPVLLPGKFHGLRSLVGYSP